MTRKTARGASTKPIEIVARVNLFSELVSSKNLVVELDELPTRHHNFSRG